ncbi:unnamed protein product [Rotaria socialis]|uniref:Ubiquitin-like domain-containing protein n=1 Tax=Rotaria socialis TaxID=392032 RepID=A0A820JNS8_9BILA|nr:unnamed protein product [Rotaria socialis]
MSEQMDASNNNDAPVTNENSEATTTLTLKVTTKTPKDERDILKDVAANEFTTSNDQMCMIYAGNILKDEDDLKKHAENDTTNKQASSTTCNDSIETFQLDFYRVQISVRSSGVTYIFYQSK